WLNFLRSPASPCWRYRSTHRRTVPWSSPYCAARVRAPMSVDKHCRVTSSLNASSYLAMKNTPKVGLPLSNFWGAVHGAGLLHARQIRKTYTPYSVFLLRNLLRRPWFHRLGLRRLHALATAWILRQGPHRPESSLVAWRTFRRSRRSTYSSCPRPYP